MKTSDAGVSLIKEFEGLRLKAYKCAAGVPTIGYGHTKGVKMGSRISAEEAERLLREDLEVFEQAVDRHVKVPLTQTQFDALVSFTYNLGAGNLASSTLLRKLNAGDYAGAQNEFHKWRKAGGRVLRGLVRRRAAEAELFAARAPDETIA